MSARGAAALVLGVETSCDDTSVAVLEGGRTLRAHLIAAQDVHRLYGGVVPELASRAHLELLPRMVTETLAAAGIHATDLTGIAVTRAPGLVGSLVVGVAFARAYGLALGIPVVGVNHIEAHLHAATLECGPSPFPALALVVSGGHTELVEVRAVGDYSWLGSTRDDAAGEAFDKVAKLLGLGFPGGPAIERIAMGGRRGVQRRAAPPAHRAVRGARHRAARALAATVRRQRGDDRAARRLGPRAWRSARPRSRRGGLARGVGDRRHLRALARVAPGVPEAVLPRARAPLPTAALKIPSLRPIESPDANP